MRHPVDQTFICWDCDTTVPTVGPQQPLGRSKAVRADGEATVPHRDLVNADLGDLLREAAAARDTTTGTRITYSPKVFIPLTMLCRDKCGYCTFAQPPARLESPYLRPTRCSLSPAPAPRSAATRRCSRWASARRSATPSPGEWLEEHGYASTVDYLAAMCELVLDETGLLPHANAGALYRDELARCERSPSARG